MNPPYYPRPARGLTEVRKMIAAALKLWRKQLRVATPDAPEGQRLQQLEALGLAAPASPPAVQLGQAWVTKVTNEESDHD